MKKDWLKSIDFFFFLDIIVRNGLESEAHEKTKEIPRSKNNPWNYSSYRLLNSWIEHMVIPSYEKNASR
jgi:hypothetical protein